jgi:TRAP-type transport system small permease protein
VDRLLGKCADTLATLAGLMLIVFTTIVAYQVLSRYVGFIPRIFWTEEVSRFTFIWMLFLGAAVAVYRGTHFVIDLFGQATTSSGRIISELVPCMAMCVVAAVMIYGGLQFAGMGLTRISTVSGIRLSWIYATIPVCGIFIIVFAIHRLVSVWRATRA